MKHRIISGLCALLLVGGMFAGSEVASASPASAATAADDAPCGLSYSWGSAEWHNCTDVGQLVYSPAYDPVSGMIFEQNQCVPAQDTELLSPTFAVLDATVVGSC